MTGRVAVAALQAQLQCVIAVGVLQSSRRSRPKPSAARQRTGSHAASARPTTTASRPRPAGHASGCGRYGRAVQFIVAMLPPPNAAACRPSPARRCRPRAPRRATLASRPSRSRARLSILYVPLPLPTNGSPPSRTGAGCPEDGSHARRRAIDRLRVHAHRLQHRRRGERRIRARTAAEHGQVRRDLRVQRGRDAQHLLEFGDAFERARPWRRRASGRGVVGILGAALRAGSAGRGRASPVTAAASCARLPSTSRRCCWNSAASNARSAWLRSILPFSSVSAICTSASANVQA